MPGSSDDFALPFDGDAAILDLARFLSSASYFAALWLDDAMIVRRKIGRYAEFVDIGAAVSDSVLPLVGQEERIAALQLAPGTSFTIPHVAVFTSGQGGEPIRLNITVFWRPKQRIYFVLLARELSETMAELVLEDEIRKRRIADAELAHINRQLEEFAYVISHDLKAPLRALRYYSGDITDALMTVPLDLPAVQGAAEHITIQTRRMSNMLSGLLEYSRIGRQQDVIETVDTAALVHEIIESVRTIEGIRIDAPGPWPSIRATPVPLDLVLRNLIDNALKHHDRAEGWIRVSAIEDSVNITFEIADDGPGIDPEWHQAIFEPFRRIDDRLHPESSGIGLALVKRTVEAAGGRIEVISDPAVARGTTFRVTWPKR
jgi:signal transduction histidine kinase